MVKQFDCSLNDLSIPWRVWAPGDHSPDCLSGELSSSMPPFGTTWIHTKFCDKHRNLDMFVGMACHEKLPYWSILSFRMSMATKKTISLPPSAAFPKDPSLQIPGGSPAIASQNVPGHKHNKRRWNAWKTWVWPTMSPCHQSHLELCCQHGFFVHLTGISLLPTVHQALLGDCGTGFRPFPALKTKPSPFAYTMYPLNMFVHQRIPKKWKDVEQKSQFGRFRFPAILARYMSTRGAYHCCSLLLFEQLLSPNLAVIYCSFAARFQCFMTLHNNRDYVFMFAVYTVYICLHNFSHNIFLRFAQIKLFTLTTLSTPEIFATPYWPGLHGASPRFRGRGFRSRFPSMFIH